jgi:signal transduction histidine kinase/ActR/RegA family two-component response regulator
MRLLSVNLQHEHDVVLVRQRALQVARLLTFEAQDQTRIATAVSEIARNALCYAGGGKVEFAIEGQSAPQVLLIRVSDRGPGIPMLQRILDEQYTSSTGMGLGILGSRRLMDQCDIQTSPQGSTVTLKKLLPRQAPVVTPRRLSQLADQLTQQRPHSPLEVVQQQNHELLRTLEELRQRQEDLLRLNRELEDTNRGVVALYAELDEKADHLRRADEMKSRFLSNMSHEFRVPINTILSLSHMLLQRFDGDLTTEQEKQVSFIRKAAENLAELVNDLLDLAKIEAGKLTVHPGEFDVTTLFSTLRGMLRPLLLNEAVELIFEEHGDIPLLVTDESKVSQILRNFISNALKFTESGEIRVSAVLTADSEAVRFAVSDTGIGIAPEDQARIFDEFIQVEHALQKRVKGTGLGLPLCKKLATLLGGSITVESILGGGSTFSVVLPLHYQPGEEPPPGAEIMLSLDPQLPVVLVVENDEATLLLYEKFLQGSGFQLLPARTVRQARDLLRDIRPQAVILDILLPGEDSWPLLAELKGQEESQDIPIMVVTTVEDQRKGLALGADAYYVKPIERLRLLDTLQRLTTRPQSA